VHDVREAVLAIRRRKGMVLDAADPDTRSVGSFFVNPTVTSDTFERLRAEAGSVPTAFQTSPGHMKMPAAWLIERAGFVRGFGDGAAGVSTKHPLALVNRGGASARDVVAMATQIKQEVGRRFGIWLLPEPIFVGFDGDADVNFLTRGRDQTTG
jgi:UDP-N-acetylmuramate dehydrogenase